MDNYRLGLLIVLGVILMLIWRAWEEEHRPPASAPAATAPTAQPHPEGTVPPAPPSASAAAPATVSEKGERITVTTDTIRAELDTQGGDLRRLSLLRHPVSVDRPNEPFALLEDSDQEFFIAQSGLIGHEGEYPTHKVRYTADKTQYQLPAGSAELRVPLHWQSGGVRYTKTFIFYRGGYVVDVEYMIENRTPKEWSGFLYAQLVHSYVARGGMFSLPTYTGGAVYTPESRYQKISFDDMASKPLNVEAAGGWAAMLQHYFVSAWVPAPKDRSQFYSDVLPNQRYVIGMKDLTPVVVAAGATGHASARLYAGPKDQERLKQIAPGLELTVDYGWLTVIAAPLFWLLSWIHHWIGNWGVSIILLTVLIKVAFYPLSATSYKSMAQMKKLQPKLQSLKERYGDDRQKLNQAMMELYKTEKINPLGGCLPIVIQIPVFLALYWVLLESVEMRQAPFALWIRDLSSPDPFFVLPIIMGITMYAQQLLNPQPPDPVQRRVFMIMPIAFTAMFLFFPAGLVLYWVVNNLLSILQQWRINQVLGAKS
ncbi:MAG: membrane protein insertase YidC [Sulfurifustaceae bacterium]